MKKLLLTVLLLFSLNFFAQSNANFTYKFTEKYASREGYIGYSDVTFIINVGGTKKIEMYENGRKTVYYQVGKVTKGYTNNGTEYQAIDVLTVDKIRLRFQLFSDTIRIHYLGIGEYIEYF